MIRVLAWTNKKKPRSAYIITKHAVESTGEIIPLLKGCQVTGVLWLSIIYGFAFYKQLLVALLIYYIWNYAWWFRIYMNYCTKPWNNFLSMFYKFWLSIYLAVSKMIIVVSLNDLICQFNLGARNSDLS